MNERNPEMTPESEEPKGGVPQDVRENLAALAGEMNAMEKAAARTWKITAALFAILIVFVAGYMYLGIYRLLKEYLDPETLVQMGITQVNTVLAANFGAPGIDSGALPQWAATTLKQKTPEFMQTTVRPELERLQAQLPEYREKWTAEVEAQAPQLMNDAVDYLQSDLLPQANKTLISFVDRSVDKLLDKVDEEIGGAVGEVITASQDSIADLSADSMPRLRAALEESFEEQMGEVLDAMFEKLDETVAEVGDHMTELLRKRKAEELEHVDMLELRLIQLTRALFTPLREAPLEAEAPGLIEQIMNELRKLQIAEPVQIQVRRSIEAGAELDLSHIPEEEREKVRKAIEEGRRKAAEARRGGPPPGAGPPPDVQKRIEEERRKGEEAARKAAAEAAR